MILAKALEIFDRERDNSLSVEHKTEWISQLDSRISSEILKPRGVENFEGYNSVTSPDTVLLAPDEYGEIYSLYMNMRLDYVNGEIGRYNNSAMLFNRMYMELFDFINRNRSVSAKNKIKAGDLIV